MDAAAATNTPTTNPDGSRMTQTDQIRSSPADLPRRTWGTDHGARSTIALVVIIRNLFHGNHGATGHWDDLIQAEAIRILRSQYPPSGNYPGGSFQSAHTVTPAFFSHGALDDRRKRLTLHDTPFLFNLVVGALARPANDQLANNELSAEPANPAAKVSSDGLTPEESEELEVEGDVYSTVMSGRADCQARSRHLASAVCSMISFSCNRRHNGLQLGNSIRFVACGVSETVNEYLHYMGLTSSRKTALVALESLARGAADQIIDSMALTQRFSPPVCIDNLDMEERVHMGSVGTQNRMFHGTWGYIHVPSKELLDSLDPEGLTLEAYHQSLKPTASMVIDPVLFLPSSSANDYAAVFKSQITRTLIKYVATPASRIGLCPLDPPTVEQVDHHAPEIHMLRLMDESDNSAEGIGQVMEALQRQSGLEPEEFFGRLQLMEGDLGTAQIFHAMRSLRSPSEHAEHNLNNVTFALGAAHTLWNISQTILLKHLGNTSAMDDLGVWRYLDALGIRPEKVVQKKDFTKMIQAMELVHEATLAHCLREVMGIQESPIEEVLPVIPTSTFNDLVNQCYARFCSPEARKLASARACPKLSNLLIRMHDFSTVVEANRAMKAGDVGRLIRIWTMWSIMTQSLPGLTHYSAYLPRLVLMITKILPPSLAKLMRHSLLVSPSGRPNHFVAKDFLLENHNYWLKFFFNRTGNGSQIDRLKRLFSSNIPLLRTMFRSLRIDSGARYVQQSHKNCLKIRALERFQQMAVDHDILGLQEQPDLARQKLTKQKPQIARYVDTYLDGIKRLKSEIRGKVTELGRFLLHIPLYEEHISRPDSETEEDMNPEEIGDETTDQSNSSDSDQVLDPMLFD
ncbi:hypothetical protein Pst134EB_008436 [Puccinia striiformis f. sp. tritici]|nr:hypothetical protein Pst134EB_008436 [Puccinia striiformis f. sp. tritici]